MLCVVVNAGLGCTDKENSFPGCNDNQLGTSHIDRRRFQDPNLVLLRLDLGEIDRLLFSAEHQPLLNVAAKQEVELSVTLEAVLFKQM